MVDIPTTEPLIIVAGDTVKWTKTLPDYPASSWTLKYYIRGNSITADITASADGDDHAVSIAKATTAAWAAGDAWMDGYVSNATERYKVYSGKVTVKPDLSAETASFEGRSHVKKVLDAIEAVLENRASKDQMSYSIAGRALSRTPISDLLLLRDKYTALYNKEQQAEAINRGEKSGNKILTKFRRPS